MAKDTYRFKILSEKPICRKYSVLSTQGRIFESMNEIIQKIKVKYFGDN